MAEGEALIRFNHRRLKLWLCGCALALTAWASNAAPILDTGDPLAFFTNAASRLLATELNLNLTRIQVYPTNQYTPAVHRLLQVAANLYDATTNRTAVLGQDFPTVFRPLFSGDASGNVFITGYTNVPSVAGISDVVLSPPFDASAIAGSVGVNVPLNVFGVPWIVGVKKGFPNFNEISMDNVVTITRKLQVTKSSLTPNAPVVATNAMYVFSISNSIGIEFWNSYTNAYTNGFAVVAYDTVSMNLTNELGFSLLSSYPIARSFSGAFWPGSTWNYGGSLNTNAGNPFFLPINDNFPFITNSAYQWGGSGAFLPVATAGWQSNATSLTLPHFGLLTTNRLQAFILALDSSGNQHVIDYVHFNGPSSQRDLTAEVQTQFKNISYNNMWDTNRMPRGTPWGIASQIGVSQGNPQFVGSYWGTGDNMNLAIAEIDGFAYFMGATPPLPVPAGYQGIYNSYVTNLTVQVPYTPMVTAFYYSSWQANDPLIHSLPGDLIFTDPTGPPRTGINIMYSGSSTFVMGKGVGFGFIGGAYDARKNVSTTVGAG